MPKEIPTLYSNVINIRTTPTELIFEFGNFFPAATGAAEVGPGNMVPEVRVVMPSQALKELAEALAEAARNAQSASPIEEVKPAPSAKAKVRKCNQ